VVGIDIVDLDEAGEPSPRFVARVLAPAERERALGGGAKAVWRLWAAKEAVYKALARRDPELPFAHARFVVDAEAGVVRHGGHTVEVCWQERGAALTCVTRGGDVLSAMAAIDDDPGARELPAAARPSRAARWLARRLLGERLGSEPDELEVVRPSRGRGSRAGAPEVWRRGRRLDGVELSLAHDGAFVACAALVRPTVRPW